MTACRCAKIDAGVGMQEHVGVRGNGNICALKGKTIGTGHGFVGMGWNPSV